jgi:hypothetical protein
MRNRNREGPDTLFAIDAQVASVAMADVSTTRLRKQQCIYLLSQAGLTCLAARLHSAVKFHWPPGHRDETFVLRYANNCGNQFHNGRSEFAG